MKPSLAKGTRDFTAQEVYRRKYIINTLQKNFELFGFQPLETPSFENLSTLTGKYGEEGDRLIFKILNSGDYAAKTKEEDWNAKNSQKLISQISEKALRYDLTVPFARFVAMNQGTLTFPFKRYQIQPVWRADRPQKGRYREFYQCDADVVGTNSLVCEAEIIAMLQEILNNLGIDFTIKINNRKILTGISEAIGAAGQESMLAIGIDKLDKIGKDAVLLELKERGFSGDSLIKLEPIFSFSGSNVEKLEFLKNFLISSEIGQKGVDELEKVLNYSTSYGSDNQKVELDITLARGLAYYTGAIFEVKVNNAVMGSISGGGRYDNLTDLFGLPGVSGVGISLGVDRIYDVLEELNLFPDFTNEGTKVVISNFDNSLMDKVLPILSKLRENNIKAELYSDATKLGKQIEYASKKSIPYFLVIGQEELDNQLFGLKNLNTGEQEKLSFQEIIEMLK